MSDSIYDDDRFVELGQIAPHSPEAEVALLGSIIHDNDCMNIVSTKLTASDFYLKRHQRIYEAMLELNRKNDNIDYITLENTLKAKHSNDEAYGGLDYLTELPTRISYIPSVDNYIVIIKGCSVKRRIIRLARQAVEKCYNHGEKSDDVFDFVQNELNTINKSTMHKEPEHISIYMKQILEDLKEEVANKNEIIGIASGIQGLDKKTLGFRDGNLVVIAGRPSTGKSSLALSTIRHIGAENKIPVLLFSAEMSAKEIAQNALSEISQSGLSGIQQGIIPLHNEENVNAGVIQLAESEIYIDDSNGISVDRVKAITRQMRTDHDIKIIFIDYLQLMKLRANHAKANLAESISDTVVELKQLAREQNIPVVLLAQVNREAMKKQGFSTTHEPIMSELKGSGGIEENADVVIIVHRPYYHSKKKEDIGKDYLIVAKNRRGQTGNVPVKFIPDCVRFEHRVVDDNSYLDNFADGEKKYPFNYN